MIVALFAVWEVEGSPAYGSFDEGQRIAYISDVGAQGLKPLFIAGCVVTGIFLDLALLSERWLRHKGRLARNMTTVERVLVSLSLIFATLGTIGIVLLSIYDTLRHPSLHILFLLFFIVGYIGTAVFVCWEYQRLGVHYRQHRVLRISFWIKLVFIVVEVILAIAYGCCLYKNRPNEGAVLEWVIALIFTVFPLSFFVDLLPAVRFKHHRELYQGESNTAEQGMAHNGVAHQPQNGGYHSNGHPPKNSKTRSQPTGGGHGPMSQIRRFTPRNF
ncbi:MAG: hypothetical protein M1837_006824 [Sclerophora amabilis]|nr:MAG: hypothetical protein M1837_006824 [Sclerophora amabilis]